MPAAKKRGRDAEPEKSKYQQALLAGCEFLSIAGFKEYKYPLGKMSPALQIGFVYKCELDAVWCGAFSHNM